MERVLEAWAEARRGGGAARVQGRGLVAPSEVGSGELVARSQMLGVSLR